jgi:alcohol dehydrogenase class IV
MQGFTFNTTPSVVFRDGAAAELGAIAGARLGPRVLVVTDPGLRKLGLCDGAIASLEAAGAEVTLYDSIEPDPTLAILDEATEAGRAAAVTGVVGFGGGSSLDIAKVAALLLGSGEPLDEAWGLGNAKGPRLPLVLVPTTAGTGSEVTPVSILTVSAVEKRGVSSPVILPDMALLDPSLTVGLPGAITAATGVDAMVHAIEAYASASPNNNPQSRMLAREALRLLGANIETAFTTPGDVAARGAMLYGSMLAGQAFANAPVAAVHALAYPIGRASTSRTGSRTRWCCRMCCASTRPRPMPPTPRSRPTPSRIWRKSPTAPPAATPSSPRSRHWRRGSTCRRGCATCRSPRARSKAWRATRCCNSACWSTTRAPSPRPTRWRSTARRGEAARPVWRTPVGAVVAR